MVWFITLTIAANTRSWFRWPHVRFRELPILVRALSQKNAVLSLAEVSGKVSPEIELRQSLNLR